MKQSIYLDYAAATPLDEAAFAAMQPYFAERFYNPSALYQSAREVRQVLESARTTVAQVIGSRPQEITFTAGGTEANNLAIHGIMQRFPEGNIVVSSIEHESVMEPASFYNRRLAPVNKKGIVDLEKLADLIDEKTVLVSIMYCNNEIGTVQPLKEIAQIVKQKRAVSARKKSSALPLYFHTDAAQAANYLDLHVSRLGVDMMTLNGGKIYSSKQSGCLYVNSGVNLQALISGGGQEKGKRSGTENVTAIIAFATMLKKVQNDRKIETERLQKLRDHLLAKISQQIPELNLNGDIKKRLPNNINVTITGIDGERFVMELDEKGVMAATGSACTAGSDEPSHVLLALGLTIKEASSSLRFSLGRFSNEAEVNLGAERIIQVFKQHKRLV